MPIHGIGNDPTRMDMTTSKTVLLIRNAAPQDFGGAETYPVSLAELLKDNGWNPIIVTGSKKLRTYAMSKGITIHNGVWWSHQNFSGKRVVLFPLYTVWQIFLTLWYAGLIIKTRAKVVHIQSRDDFIGASIAGKILRRRVIWTDHMDLRYILKNTALRFKNPVGKLVLWSARWADHIIIISNNEKRLITKQLKNKNALNNKIVIVKNGVIDTANTIQPSPSDTPFVFCLASRIVKNKGVGDAIEAFRIASTKLKDADLRLAIYGDGADLSLFQQQASGIKGIEFHGHQSKVLENVARANVYMLPSYQEGFSIALLEATMLGKTIIATDVDSNSEIVEHKVSGLLVPPHSPEQLAAAMIDLYTHPEVSKQYAKNARIKYEREFNLAHKVQNEILPLYK